MSSNDKKNYVIALLACTTLAGAGMWIRTRQDLAEARKAPSIQVTRSEFNTSAAPAPLVTSAAPIAAAESLATTEEPNERPEGGPPQGGPGNWGNRGQRGAQFAAQMAELMKDPEFAAAWKLDQEARLDDRYGALFKDLNLPPDQLAAFKSLLAEREAAGREVWMSAAAQGMNPRENRDELRQLAQDLEAEVDANIKNTFGPAVVDALASYNNTGSQRNTVEDLGEKLTYAGQSLNDSQARQLTNILVETGTQAGRNTLITDATITRAAAVLTNAQLEQLKKLQAEQQARQVIEQKTREAREAMRNRNQG